MSEIDSEYAKYSIPSKIPHNRLRLKLQTQNVVKILHFFQF